MIVLMFGLMACGRNVKPSICGNAPDEARALASPLIPHQSTLQDLIAVLGPYASFTHEKYDVDFYLFNYYLNGDTSKVCVVTYVSVVNNIATVISVLPTGL